MQYAFLGQEYVSDKNRNMLTGKLMLLVSVRYIWHHIFVYGITFLVDSTSTD